MTDLGLSARRFRKRPVVIEAMQLTWESAPEVLAFCDGKAGYDPTGKMDHLIIRTLEGTMRADWDDWVICGVKGEFYPCDPDIFAATYEELY